MPYLIDGHNLIGQLTDIALDDPDDEAKLVQKLTAFVARTGKRCVVVFDTGLPGGKSRMSTSKVEVVFAGSHLNADRILMERIGAVHDPANWTIVSSDNEVLNRAGARGMKLIRSADFARQLQPAPKRPPAPDDKPLRDIHLSQREVEEWLEIFNARRGKK